MLMYVQAYACMYVYMYISVVVNMQYIHIYTVNTGY